MVTPIHATLLAWFIALVPLGAQPAADEGWPINRLVVFGDSLSDPGNAFIETGDFELRPFDPIPGAPYLIGRFHFSNGRTWIEWLATRLGLHRGGRPASLVPGRFTNYAYGSARARPTGTFHLDKQVDLFLSDFDGVAAPDTLYAVWIGANDLRDALAALQEDPTGTTSQGLIEAAIGATAGAIQQLHAAGARAFLVLNLPNIGDAPALSTQGPAAQAAGASSPKATMPDWRRPSTCWTACRRSSSSVSTCSPAWRNSCNSRIWRG
jgi:outer membrane lipase/esterase